MAFRGRKPIVVCNGQAYEAEDLDDAKEKAKELVGQTKSPAWVLTPTTKFSPEGGVVETPIRP